jgi:hypothetical protein
MNVLDCSRVISVRLQLFLVPPYRLATAPPYSREQYCRSEGCDSAHDDTDKSDHLVEENRHAASVADEATRCLPSRAVVDAYRMMSTRAKHTLPAGQYNHGRRHSSDSPALWVPETRLTSCHLLILVKQASTTPAPGSRRGDGHPDEDLRPVVAGILGLAVCAEPGPVHCPPRRVNVGSGDPGPARSFPSREAIADSTRTCSRRHRCPAAHGEPLRRLQRAGPGPVRRRAELHQHRAHAPWRRCGDRAVVSARLVKN